MFLKADVAITSMCLSWV